MTLLQVRVPGGQLQVRVPGGAVTWEGARLRSYSGRCQVSQLQMRVPGDVRVPGGAVTGEGARWQFQLKVK